ncbi:unnamed protein product [Caretta caretta]
MQPGDPVTHIPCAGCRDRPPPPAGTGPPGPARPGPAREVFPPPPPPGPDTAPAPCPPHIPQHPQPSRVSAASLPEQDAGARAPGRGPAPSQRGQQARKGPSRA